MNPPWEVLSTRRVHDGRPFVEVACETVRLPDGRVVEDYHRVVLPDYAVGVPILEDGRILTQWQYKHGAGCVSLTFPAGHIEAGEAPEAAIRRELLEETGHAAAGAIGFGGYVVSGNQGCGRAHLFALTGCRKVAEPDHDDLEEWTLRPMHAGEVEGAIRDGKLAILPHLAVWAVTRARLGL